MKWSRRQPLLATYNVRHLHQVVVNDIGEVISGQVVSTFIEYFVVDDATVDNHISADKVVNGNVTIRLHLETHHIFRSALDKVINLLLAKCK